jgi:proteasome assembly chaperone (PAC2) family protein
VWKLLQTYSEPGPLRDPLLLVCLSTSNPEYRLLYSQARELGRFLLRKLDFQMFASLYSSALPPEIKVSNDGLANLVSNNFYLYAGKKRDYVLVAGHASPSEDQYDYAETILTYAKELGIKEMVSFGARWTETVLPPTDSPKITGFASSKEGAKLLEDAGITISRNESAFYFGNLIVPMCKSQGIQGYKVSVDHGEPAPHPRSVIGFLDVLSKVFGLSLDISDLQTQARELADSLRKSAVEDLDENGEPRGSQNDDIYR